MKRYEKPDFYVVYYTPDALVMSSNAALSGTDNLEVNDSSSWNNDKVI